MPYLEHARNRAGRRPGLELRIRWIDRAHTIDREVVMVDLGRDRTDCHTPDAIDVLREIPWTVEELAGEDHFIGLWRVQTKRHAAVGENVRRHDLPRLLGRRVRR
jgi:hypothetical protein